MIVKAHFSKNQLILAVCDNDVLNKKFVDGDLQLDLTSDFYKGEEKSEEEILALIKKAYIVNAVGKSSVACCIKAGIIDKNKVKNIKKIPYTYMVRF